MSSCSTLPNLKTEHVVMVNRTGDLIDPRANIGKLEDGKHILFKPYTELDKQAVDDYFTKLLTSLEQIPIRTGGKKKRIFLYVHGGLNTAQTSIERVVEYSPKIMEDGTYPIFVNWDSSLTSSYRDHLVLLRQGRRADDWCCGAWKEYGKAYAIGANIAGGVASVVTTPLYFAFDLVRGVIRLPVDIYGVYADLLSSHWRSVFTDEKTGTDHWPDGNCAQNAKLGMTPRADRLLCEVQHPPTRKAPYPFVQGENKRTGPESAWQIVRTVVTVPVHIGSGLIIDMAGTGSWSSMHRRTTVMFNRDRDLWSPDPHTAPTGGIAQFMMRLRTFLEEHRGKNEWEVVLVGHSMGTIVANEMVRQFGHPLTNSPGEPLFDEIVFMAAACSLRDYLNTIPHYLEEYKTTRMYHLMLHDQAESTEQALWGTALPGSLLVWLDGFFTRPDSPLDLVAGRYQNLLRVMHELLSNVVSGPLLMRRRVLAW
jgi:pimeloyl-ACP methyl ester carboxylesterase